MNATDPITTQIPPAPGAWQRAAACQGHDPERFFPPQGQDDPVAKAVCRTCPVQLSCLAFALAHGERFGIWGGLTSRERTALAAEDRRRIVARAVRAA